jgi:OOP family OmpA-OmpF porin
MKSSNKRISCWVIISLLLLFTVSCSTKKTLVVLLPDYNSPQGKLAIGQGERMTVLDSPMTAAEVDAQGRVEKEAITQAEVDKTFAEALAALPPQQISFILYFEEGSTEVLEGSKNTLSELFEEVSKRQAVEVQVTGHTDTVGGQADNDRLSKERMQTIKEWFIKRGLQASFIRAVGRGERELLIQTPDNVREPRNRRVEVIVR